MWYSRLTCPVSWAIILGLLNSPVNLRNIIMNRKLLSIIIIFALSLNLCFSTAAAACTGGTDCMHCNSMQSVNTSKNQQNQKSGCCETKQPTTCESKEIKPLNQLFIINANVVKILFDSVADNGIIIDQDFINSSANGLNLETLLPPLIPPAPIYLQNLSLIIWFLSRFCNQKKSNLPYLYLYIRTDLKRFCSNIPYIQV